MLTRVQLTVIAGLTMGISLLWLWLQGKQPTIVSVAATLGTVVSVVYAAVVVFANHLWRWAVFRGWLVNRPDMRGSWRATLYSDWKNPSTGQKEPPVEAYVIIRQTLTTFSMRLFTKRSRSKSVAYAIETEPDGLFKLSLVYRNEPRIELQGTESSIHHGSLLMDVDKVQPQQLSGHYWTDRGTRGSIEMRQKGHFHFSSFEEGVSVLRGR